MSNDFPIGIADSELAFSVPRMQRPNYSKSLNSRVYIGTRCVSLRPQSERWLFPNGSCPLLLTVTTLSQVPPSRNRAQNWRQCWEVHALESSGFHGAMLRQLLNGSPLAIHLSTDPLSSDLSTPDESEQKAGCPECNGRAVMW